jgi:hypothetical protein
MRRDKKLDRLGDQIVQRDFRILFHGLQIADDVGLKVNLKGTDFELFGRENAFHGAMIIALERAFKLVV